MSESFVDTAAMFDGVQRDSTLSVIHPKEDAPITDAIFLQAFQVGREVA